MAMLLNRPSSLKPSKKYDYIICGAGCAGLSLAIHMISSGKLAGKTILLLDKGPKTTNDRTWCFWEKESGLFEPVVFRQWDQLWFYGEDLSRLIGIDPYRYKMIRSIDFYEYCFRIIRQQANFEIRFGQVEESFSREKTGVRVDGEELLADYVFNSILLERPALRPREFWMLQHFEGWMVETEEDSFDTKAATLMDLRVDQSRGTTFGYVLPLSARSALVEYTLFSPHLLQPQEYEQGLRNYIDNCLKIGPYKITGREYGVIPMTNFNFPSRENNMVRIGTAGGQTKGSSGYTFRFIQKHSKAMVDSLVEEGHPFVPPASPRFRFYDSVLLNVLDRKKVSGKKVFTNLFQKNPVDRVLRFLDNESSLAEELKIISGLPLLPFLRAGLQELF